MSEEADRPTDEEAAEPAGDGDPGAEADAPPAADPSSGPEGPAEAAGPVGDAAGLEEAEAAIEADLAQIARERDEYLDSLKRLQADFENYRKRVAKQQADDVLRGVGRLVQDLLPVLDAADQAVAHDQAGGAAIRSALVGVLERAGLERLDPVDEPFDPEVHEAVAHEAGDGGAETVVEVLRAGYRWQGKVLRPAMVRVKS